MEKEMFKKGSYYEYEGKKAYAYQNNSLVLETGMIVKRTKGKYTPDRTTYGSADNKGYLRVKVGSTTVGVHRLVAAYFVENPENFNVVDHINENKEDNSKENLQWVTLEHNSSRVNIRENRALNEAREVLKVAREKEVLAKKYFEDVKKEQEELDVQRQTIANMIKMFKEEIEGRIKTYEEKVDNLVEIANSEVGRAERARVRRVRKESMTREEMIATIGKKISVNDKIYPSIRSAARFIVGEERRKHNLWFNVETIRKELKRVQTGARPEGVMYSRYEIKQAK